MEKFIMVILSVLTLCALSFTQTTPTMNIHTGTGTDIYNLADIDSITFNMDTGIVTDIDGNIYHTVTIGTQVWLVENLRVTHYRNGDPIPNVTDGTQWAGLTSGAYCNYDNDSTHASIYGRLYNWFAVDDPRGLAPAGWHVPTDAEWDILINYLGGSSVAGGAMKDSILWQPPNTGATNSSGFSALPGGGRHDTGSFFSMSITASFWSSTEYDTSNAWYRNINYNGSGVNRYDYNKHYGFSVRCVRN